MNLQKSCLCFPQVLELYIQAITSSYTSPLSISALTGSWALGRCQRSKGWKGQLGRPPGVDQERFTLSDRLHLRSASPEVVGECMYKGPLWAFYFIHHALPQSQTHPFIDCVFTQELLDGRLKEPTKPVTPLCPLPAPCRAPTTPSQVRWLPAGGKGVSGCPECSSQTGLVLTE